MLNSTAVIVVLVVSVILYLLYRVARQQLWVLFAGPSSENPFKGPYNKRKGHPIVTDQKQRDAVLKQSFSMDKIPPQLDAIVIGSGIGGLSVASILSKVGKKVLVLEQHDQAGGCCHTFIDKGFEFDTGIHYVGEMSEGAFNRVLVDQLSESGIEWEQLEEVYDTVVLGMGQDDPAKRKSFPISSGRGKLMETLIESFPDEEKNIRKYFALLRRLRRLTVMVTVLKALPKCLSHFLIFSGIVRRFAPDLVYFERSLSDVLNEVTDNKELKAVLAYSFGDYGTVPKDASFGMQALLTFHFVNGGYYPVGGASEIAFNIIPTIEAAGGKVLVRARVTDILFDEGTNRVTGVRVKQGHTVFEILAPLVISDAGVHNTFESLLPKEAVKKFKLKQLLKRVRHGFGLMSVFIGLDGTKEELGLKASNTWAFRDADLDKAVDDYISLTPEEAMTAEVPLMFVSFPSTKDPTYNERYPGKTTCTIVTMTPYEWFEEWKDGRVQHRGQEYDALKNAIATQMWNQVCDLYPQLEGRKEYMDVGTPLSNIYYLGTPQGEVYGVDHNTTRFTPRTITDLRPDVGIPGLYMTGQDVFICGFGGAIVGGVLCASTILKRNLLGDLIKLTTKLKRERNSEKKKDS